MTKVITLKVSGIKLCHKCAFYELSPYSDFCKKARVSKFGVDCNLYTPKMNSKRFKL